jgi:hypothetical protein
MSGVPLLRRMGVNLWPAARATASISCSLFMDGCGAAGGGSFGAGVLVSSAAVSAAGSVSRAAGKVDSVSVGEYASDSRLPDMPVLPEAVRQLPSRGIRMRKKRRIENCIRGILGFSTRISYQRESLCAITFFRFAL